MKDDFLVLDIKIAETIDIICYEGIDEEKLLENNDELCHCLRIKPVNDRDYDKLYEKNENEILEYSILYIYENKIVLYDFNSGDAIEVSYSKMEETKLKHEEILNAKISFLIGEKDNDLLSLNNNYKYYCWELKNLDRKIFFNKIFKNEEKLHMNMEKREMISIILNEIKERKSTVSMGRFV